jgi:hypothetical protein
MSNENRQQRVLFIRRKHEALHDLDKDQNYVKSGINTWCWPCCVLLLEEEMTPHQKVVFCQSLKRGHEKNEREKERKKNKKSKEVDENYV